MCIQQRFSGPRQIETLKQPNTVGRSMRLVGGKLTLTTSAKRKLVSETYQLLEIGSDIGRGFALHKLGGDHANYHTHIGGTGLVDCDCDGYDKGGYCCKHIAALQKLLEIGMIPGGIPG